MKLFMISKTNLGYNSWETYLVVADSPGSALEIFFREENLDPAPDWNVEEISSLDKPGIVYTDIY